MSVHRGAQVLLGNAAGGMTLKAVPISLPAQAPISAGLQTILNALSAGDSLASAYTVTVTYTPATTDTYTTAQSVNGKYYAVDSSNYLIYYP